MIVRLVIRIFGCSRKNNFYHHFLYMSKNLILSIILYAANMGLLRFVNKLDVHTFVNKAYTIRHYSRKWEQFKKKLEQINKT